MSLKILLSPTRKCAACDGNSLSTGTLFGAEGKEEIVRPRRIFGLTMQHLRLHANPQPFRRLLVQGKILPLRCEMETEPTGCNGPLFAPKTLHHLWGNSLLEDRSSLSMNTPLPLHRDALHGCQCRNPAKGLTGRCSSGSAGLAQQSQAGPIGGPQATAPKDPWANRTVYKDSPFDHLMITVFTKSLVDEVRAHLLPDLKPKCARTLPWLQDFLRSVVFNFATAGTPCRWQKRASRWTFHVCALMMISCASPVL